MLFHILLTVLLQDVSWLGKEAQNYEDVRLQWTLYVYVQELQNQLIEATILFDTNYVKLICSSKDTRKEWEAEMQANLDSFLSFHNSKTSLRIKGDI